MPLDILSTLAPTSWRGIPFPVSALETSFSHAGVEHAWVYRNGVHVEWTGRNALIFNLRLPFNNAVQAAPFEPWIGQILYPDIFGRFLDAVLDGSSGELVHPVFGPLQCKPRDGGFHFTGNGTRDGAEVTCRFVHTIDDIDAVNDSISLQSPMAAAISNADVLDTELAKTGPLPELGNDKKSFSDMVASVNDGTGNTSAVKSKLENTSSALDRLDDVGLWPVRNAVENLRSSIYDIDSFSGTTNKPVRETTVIRGTSLAGIALRLGVPVDSLISLNPKLARDPYVNDGTRVRYAPNGT